MRCLLEPASQRVRISWDTAQDACNLCNDLDELVIPRGKLAVREQQIVLEADPSVSAQSQRSGRAAGFILSEGADRPGNLAGTPCTKKGEKVRRLGWLFCAIMTEDEQHPMAVFRDDAAFPEPQVVLNIGG